MNRDDRAPGEIRTLLDERTEARASRDWDRADALRDRIAALGWEIQDGPRGSTLRPLLPAEPTATGYANPDDLASVLDQPATVAASVQVVAEDHPDDLRRLFEGLAAHPPSVSWELVAGVALASVGFAAVGTLLAAMAAASRARELLLPLLFLPLVIPIVVGGVGASIADDPGRYLGFLALYDLIFAILSWASFEYVVTE